MKHRLFRNLRLKAVAVAAAALATLGLFGLMRVETPTRASAPQSATPAGSQSSVPAGTPSVDLPTPATLSPANRLPAGAVAPQLPTAPAPRPRPITRTRAS